MGQTTQNSKIDINKYLDVCHAQIIKKDKKVFKKKYDNTFVTKRSSWFSRLIGL